MNYHNPRRSFTVPSGGSEAIPHAPPLPTVRPLQRAREAATRLFGYQSRPASPQLSPENERVTGSQTEKPRYASMSAAHNATTSHRTGLEINTISINEKGTHALLGGKEIFKTVKVEGGRCAEDLNLRSVIRSKPTQASGGIRKVYSIDIADVAWAKGDSGDYVAAATSSGKIILYDLGHAGLPAAQLHDHFRQVHRITFNPHRGSLLLSGSQDGTVRLWDVRDVKLASTLQSRRKYSGQSDGVRDVKWSPTDGVDFAFGTDSGYVHRWDMRNLKTAKVKIPAHSVTCNSVDWHPDGQHIASASADKTVRVWDSATNRKQQHPSWEIKTPYRISNARWRPSCQSSMFDGNAEKHCTQLVTAYDADHPVLHVWDLRRSAPPFREIHSHASAPSDMLWHSQDLLWTVTKDGVFLQTDIQHAAKTLDKRNMQAFAIAPQGDFAFITQKRFRPRVRGQSSFPRAAASYIPSKASSRSESPGGGRLSRSWTDDGLDRSFLAAKAIRTEHVRSSGSTRAPSISTSSPLMTAVTMNLEDALREDRSAQPVQVAIGGQMPIMPLTQQPEVFEYLAKMCRFDLRSVAHDETFLESFAGLLDHNAECAQHVGLHLTAKTWRMIRFSMTSHLRKRVEARSNGAVQRVSLDQGGSDDAAISGSIIRSMEEHGTQKSPIMRSKKPVSAIAKQLTLSEALDEQKPPAITSPADARTYPVEPKTVSQLAIAEQSDLQPLSSREASPSEAHSNIPDQATQLTTRNLDGLQKLKEGITTTDKAARVRTWSIQPKEPLNLDSTDANGVKIPNPTLVKHTSNESFMFLQDGSADSADPSFPASFESVGSAPLQMVAERPSRSAVRHIDAAAVDVEAQDFDKRAKMALGPQRLVSTSHEKAAAVQDIRSKRSPQQHNGPSREVPETSPYLPQNGDEDVEEGAMFSMITLLRELVTYYADRGNAQVASQLLLLLSPLLPPTHPTSTAEIESTISIYKDYFTSKDYTDAEIGGLVGEHLKPVLKAGLQPLQVEAIISRYHEQLVVRKFYAEAAVLRQLAFPMYPSVYEDYVKNNVVRMHCGSCGRPLAAADRGKLLCESCGSKRLNCSICWSVVSPYEEMFTSNARASKLLTACLRCGHVIHAACLRMWVASGERGCTAEGCVCDCVV